MYTNIIIMENAEIKINDVKDEEFILKRRAHVKNWYENHKEEHLKNLKIKKKCDLCGKMVNSYTMKRHQKSHLCKSPISKTLPKKEKLSIKNVTCDICGRTVKYYYLATHQKNKVCKKII